MKALKRNLRKARLVRAEEDPRRKAKLQQLNRPLSPGFDNIQFVSRAEEQEYHRLVKQAIEEMPCDPEQCAQDMAAICEIELKVYHELVAKRQAQ